MSSADIIIRSCKLQTKMFNDVLEGISDKESLHRFNDKGNHLRWLAGHLTGIRYRFVKRLGGQIEDFPFNELYYHKDMPPPNAKALDINVEYPTLKEMLSHWNEVSPVLIDAITKLSDAQLNAESPFSPPIGGNKVIDGLSFMPLHEFYHIGQMSLIRTSLGHSSLKFN